MHTRKLAQIMLAEDILVQELCYCDTGDYLCVVASGQISKYSATLEHMGTFPTKTKSRSIVTNATVNQVLYAKIFENYLVVGSQFVVALWSLARYNGNHY